MLHMFALAGVLTTLTRCSFPFGSATSKALHANANVYHTQKQNCSLQRAVLNLRFRCIAIVDVDYAEESNRSIKSDYII